MEVSRVTKIVKVDSKYEIIRFQLTLDKFIRGLKLSDAEICTISFVLDKGYYQGIFADVVKAGFFKNEQSARNCIIKAVKIGILTNRKDNYEAAEQLVVGENSLVEVKVHNLKV